MRVRVDRSRISISLWLTAGLLAAWLLTTSFAFMPSIGEVRPDALVAAEEDPALTKFVGQVRNGRSDVVTGVYAPTAGFAYPVIQQPVDQPVFVSREPNTLTQFRTPLRYGVTGFLAHNYLAGAKFYSLDVGDEIGVVHGDGRVSRYRVEVIRRFQALSPHDPKGDLVDLDAQAARPGETPAPQSVADVFYQVYSGGDRVVFQTCIQANGNPSWGRLFVIAVPIEG